MVMISSGMGRTVQLKSAVYTRAGPPYFHSYLPQPTTADIDVRLIVELGGADISITHIELYVRHTDP